MAVIEIAKIQVRRGQEQQTGVPPLAGGEFAWAADTENLYIGLKKRRRWCKRRQRSNFN